MAFIWDARQTPRTRTETRVAIECDRGHFRGVTVDLNERGMGITCAAPFYFDQQITLTFFAGTSESQRIVVSAVIRHSNGTRHGCEFVSVSAADREAIRALISQPKARAAVGGR
jgi:c-di-GMP-binding flagellar brake protein YcgR